jgi:ATP-dependent DNA ligase
MARIARRSAAPAPAKRGPRETSTRIASPPRWIEPQLCKLVEKAPSGSDWVHEIKFDGYRMAARIDHGDVQLLTRSGLDWTEKYPETAAALAKLPVTTAYLDGELCGSTSRQPASHLALSAERLGLGLLLTGRLRARTKIPSRKARSTWAYRVAPLVCPIPKCGAGNTSVQ